MYGGDPRLSGPSRSPLLSLTSPAPILQLRASRRSSRADSGKESRYRIKRRAFPHLVFQQPFPLPPRRSTRPPSPPILVRAHSLHVDHGGGGYGGRSLADVDDEQGVHPIIIELWSCRGPRQRAKERTSSMRAERARGASTCCSTTTEAPTRTTRTTRTTGSHDRLRLKSEVPRVGHAHCCLVDPISPKQPGLVTPGRHYLVVRREEGGEPLLHMERCLRKRSEIASEQPRRRGRD